MAQAGVQSQAGDIGGGGTPGHRPAGAEREAPGLYELVWHTGAAQSDAACLLAEDINWITRTISYSRKKLESRAPVELSCGDGV